MSKSFYLKKHHASGLTFRKPVVKRIRYRCSDGGRKAAGYRGDNAGDCATRALAHLTGLPYKQIHQLMLKAQSYHRPFGRGVYNIYCPAVKFALNEVFGVRQVKDYWEIPAPSLSEIHAMYGNCIIEHEGHWAALVNGELLDNRNCRREKVIGVWKAEKTRYLTLRV